MTFRKTKGFFKKASNFRRTAKKITLVVATSAFMTFGVLTTNTYAHAGTIKDATRKYQTIEILSNKLNKNEDDKNNDRGHKNKIKKWHIKTPSYTMLKNIRLNITGTKILTAPWENGTCFVIKASKGNTDGLIYYYDKEEKRNTAFSIVERRKNEKYLGLYCSEKYTLIFTSKRVMIYVGALDFFTTSKLEKDGTYIDVSDSVKIKKVEKTGSDMYQILLSDGNKYTIQIKPWPNHETMKIDVKPEK